MSEGLVEVHPKETAYPIPTCTMCGKVLIDEEMMTTGIHVSTFWIPAPTLLSGSSIVQSKIVENHKAKIGLLDAMWKDRGGFRYAIRVYTDVDKSTWVCSGCWELHLESIGRALDGTKQ